MSKLVIATGNPGKRREFARLFAASDLVIDDTAALHMENVEETGGTFVENAILKARYAATVSGLPALADDSGLEVDALDGGPGIHSARFAGPGASDADNLALLLERLAGVPPDRRSARFRCLLVVMRHATDPAPLICAGCWHGRIATAASGDGGFGYDPVFVADGMTQSAAALPAAEKARISHRGQALAALLRELPAFLATAPGGRSGGE